MADKYKIKIGGKNYEADAFDMELRPHPYAPGIGWQVDVTGEGLTEKEKKEATDEYGKKLKDIKIKNDGPAELVEFRAKVLGQK